MEHNNDEMKRNEMKQKALASEEMRPFIFFNKCFAQTREKKDIFYQQPWNKTILDLT